MSVRNMTRSAARGAVLLVAVLVTGCSGSGGSSSAPSSALPVTPSSAPSAPASPEATPEPSPVVSYLAGTKIVTLGGTEVRVTRNDVGFEVVGSVTHTHDVTLNIRVTVSVGNGKDWVRTTKLYFPKVAPGQTSRETALVRGSYQGELPDGPKVHIDSVINY
ncbi:hypothetical protein OH738_22600 [Streptomyces hirsutus]|uniref:Lipoprotein n=1 Tax=Streptomyces hirsutus TaxID=35620 RepID=A0ABZ1GMA0_9ACTN|nr:hypothetical protein [Streptomyces hirsutus]WSD07302.1 hypothetical protein OIE73_17045 [Streptomyces hirsutus]WTD19278.1 hypothetical protein OH738_22600 [Streptomyces hirsutus]